jgi:hypothetical protein
MNSKVRNLILTGLKTTGNYDDCLEYITESLTVVEYWAVKAFFEYLKAAELTVGWGNIDLRWKMFIADLSFEM